MVDQFGLVGREVVEDDVHLAVSRLLGDEGERKATNSELVSRSADLPWTLPVATSRASYRERVPLRTYSKQSHWVRPGEKGNIGRGSVEGLYRSLLVDAECDRVLRRVEVEADHFQALALRSGLLEAT